MYFYEVRKKFSIGNKDFNYRLVVGIVNVRI